MRKMKFYNVLVAYKVAWYVQMILIAFSATLIKVILIYQ